MRSKRFLGSTALTCVLLAAGGAAAADGADPATACRDAAGAQFEPGSAGQGQDFERIDTATAVPLCRAALAEDPGSVATTYRLARALAAAEEYPEAIRLFSAAATAGYAPARSALGAMYLQGTGVPQNDDVAARWYRQAADQGYAPARYGIGWLYEQGRGVPEDAAAAARWYEAAAAQGFLPAQTSLARLYDSGTGVPQSYAQAALWYRAAAEQGDMAAQTILGSRYYDGYGVPRDDAQAAYWFRQAADQGYAEAQYDLGLMVRDGRGVARDPGEAERLFRLAADQGMDRAQTALADLATPPPASNDRMSDGEAVAALLILLGGAILADMESGSDAANATGATSAAAGPTSAAAGGNWQAEFWCWTEYEDYQDPITYANNVEPVTYCEDRSGGVWDRNDLLDPCSGVEGWCDGAW